MADYTDPELRERLKQEIIDGDRGGKPGQWSARKAQLLAREYEKAGGGYKGAKDARQKHLDEWTEQDWQTKDGGADAGHGEHRYLPDAAWKLLTPKEREATETKKHEGSEQHVANTDAAKAARKAVEATSKNAGEASKAVRRFMTTAELDKAAKAEKAGAGRKTVLEVIERRRAQV